jgi:hypothetical protein
MGFIDFRQLDKDIARGARAERAWRRMLRTDATLAAAEPWFEPVRHVTTRTTFQEITELPEADPLREPLLGWIYRLSLTRIAGAQLVQTAYARQNATFDVEKPERGTFSARNLMSSVLRATDAEKARAWSRALEESGPSILAAERTLRQAELEIIGRLGAAELSLDSPYPRDALVEQAALFMSRTDDLASSLLRDEKDIATVVQRALGRDVPGVWPTRASSRWLFDQFQSTEFLGGLSLDLGQVPPTLGASSFARALARFGAAYARAAASSKEMFAVAHDPTDAHPLRRGALFASLLADPLYLRRQLGFSRAAAEKAARSLAATLLVEARLCAARTTTDTALAAASETHELMEHALKTRVSPELSGVLPRPCRQAPLRFGAMLMANDDRELLRGEFDEDWFRNPRALLFLRDRDEAYRWSRQPKEVLEGTAERLAKELEQKTG